MAVAIVTGGYVRGDGRFPERHRFAVIRFAVVCEAILVTFAATRVAGHFEVAVLRRLYFMRRVTIGAHGAALVALREQLPVNALIVSLLDADMALAAGLCDVHFVD